MEYTTLLGFIAAACTSSAFLPQAYKVWRSKKTGDLSLGMFGTFTLGILLWLTYGILRSDLVLIVANGFTLIFAGYILAMKLKHG